MGLINWVDLSSFHVCGLGLALAGWWPNKLAGASFSFRLHWARQKLALVGPIKIHVTWVYMSHLTCGLRPDLFIGGPIHFGIEKMGTHKVNDF